MIDSLPITTQTAYAELVEQLLMVEAHRSIGHVAGGFVTKEIKGRTYVYFQYSTPGGATKQLYIGARSKEIDRLTARFTAERVEVEKERERIGSLAHVVRAGGVATTDAASARVIAALAEAGVFKLGGVLVGTHAFIAAGNLLGIRLGGTSARTEDIDVAAKVLEVALPDVRADVPKAIASLDMGFLPVPGFSPKDPSTSFKIRGRGLRVDVVTPARRDGSGPVMLRRFNTAAAPVRFLDYILDDSQFAAVINGGAILVSIPDPARLGIQKLLVAQDRPATFQTKARKDVAQAALLLDAVEQIRPGDIKRASRDAVARGMTWAKALARGKTLLERHEPDVFHRVKKALGTKR